MPNSWRSESCSWPVIKGLTVSSCRVSQARLCQVAQRCYCVHADCQEQLLPSDGGLGFHFTAHVTGAEPSPHRGAPVCLLPCQDLVQAHDFSAFQGRIASGCSAVQLSACQELMPAGLQEPDC